MANTGLLGSYPLTRDGIAENVTIMSAGAYALGHTSKKLFYVNYVGHSDVDVNSRLHKHVGNYERFKFEYYPSAKAAFEKECQLYHDFDPRDNKAHPDRPNNSGWKCPACKIFD